MWVLSAHVYALLVPLFFVFAVWANWDFLLETTDSPFLFFVAAVLMAAGGAFEAAQNTMDRWYLTEDSPSANGVGLLDFMFYWMITSGSAAAALAIGGDQAWVWVVSAAVPDRPAAAVLLRPALLRAAHRRQPDRRSTWPSPRSATR